MHRLLAVPICDAVTGSVAAIPRLFRSVAIDHRLTEFGTGWQLLSTCSSWPLPNMIVTSPAKADDGKTRVTRTTRIATARVCGSRAARWAHMNLNELIAHTLCPPVERLFFRRIAGEAAGRR